MRLTGITKRFGAVRALTGVSFELRAGEVHALMGENGAGKSTLMNIVGGVLQPDGGEIEIEGKAVKIADPGGGASGWASGWCIRRSRSALTYRSPKTSSWPRPTRGAACGWIPRDLRRRAEAVLADLHEVPVTALAGALPIASQQIVEIAKALTLNCKVLIFDEPTAALTEAEAERLFAIIRGLRARGIGIIYISHRMAEIFRDLRPHHRAARRRFRRHAEDRGDDARSGGGEDGRPRTARPLSRARREGERASRS